MNELKRLIIKNRKFLIVIMVTVAVYLSFRYLLPLFIPFIIAYLLALPIRRPVRFIYKKTGIKPIITGTFFTVIMVVLIGIGLYFLINLAIEQLVSLIQNMPEHIRVLEMHLHNICKSCDRWLGCAEGTVGKTVLQLIDNALTSIRSEVMSAFPDKAPSIMFTAAETAGTFLIMVISIILITKDMGEYTEKTDNGKKLYPWFDRVRKSLADAGMTYLKVQGIIILIIAAVCCTGLFLIGNNYALLFGFTIAVVDAFPVLGSGLILVPWGIVEAFQGHYKEAAVLIIMCILCQIIREIIEPRLLGNKIGLKPIYTLIAMYAGIKLFGLIGFLLGPLGLIIIKNVCCAIVNEGAEEEKKP